MKKQDQRLADLKKLMQRELKILPPPSDDDIATTQSVPMQMSMSSRSLRHVRNSSSVSVDSVSAVRIHTSATPVEAASSAAQSGMSVTAVGDVRNGSGVSLDLASAAGVHKSATTSHADPSSPTSPATLSISDQHTVNGQFTAINCGSSRSGRGQRSVAKGQRSQTGVIMSPADCEYDFVRELNFKYLRHVVLKFMLSRETEVITFLKYNL